VKQAVVSPRVVDWSIPIATFQRWAWKGLRHAGETAELADHARSGLLLLAGLRRAWDEPDERNLRRFGLVSPVQFLAAVFRKCSRNGDIMQNQIVARLTAPIIAVSGLSIVVALGVAWYARDSQRSVSMMLDTHIASVRAAQELEISLREIHVQFDRYLITGDRRYLDSVPRLRQRAADTLQEADTFATTEQEQVLMRRVRKGYDHFFAEYERLEHTPPPQGMYTKVLELIDTVLAREILEPAREYLRVNEGMLTHAAKTNREMAQRLTLGLGVCVSIAGLLGCWAIAGSLRRSLRDTDRLLHNTAAQLGEAAHVSFPAHAIEAAGSTLQHVAHRHAGSCSSSGYHAQQFRLGGGNPGSEYLGIGNSE